MLRDEKQIIEIDLVDENEISLDEDNMDVNKWYSCQLKSLDIRYPEVFDRVTKEIMQNEETSSQGQPLKTVLGKLFSNVFFVSVRLFQPLILSARTLLIRR